MKRKECRFSVVIPAYNAAKWLEETLGSWVRQTVDDFEVIVVDDGSQDETVAIAHAFESRLNLRVIQERRSGAPAHPRNVGSKAARGELIVPCDADDLAAPDRLERTYFAWEMAGQRACLIFSDFAVIDAHGNNLKNRGLAEYSALRLADTQFLDVGVTLLPASAAFDALLAGDFHRPCATAFPKTVFERVGGYDESLLNGQDFDLAVRIAREYPFIWLHRVLSYYRSTTRSISSRSPIELVPSRVAVLQRLLGYSLTRKQEHTVRDWIAANYEMLGYDYGNQGRVWQSIRAYWEAFLQRPATCQPRGVAVSLAKAVLGRRVA
ncbi:MAG: glycosyltransferase [Gammaproteobacteria bacterium]|nr:glycosyltransferase [Gammaproteobacteria bacterium]